MFKIGCVQKKEEREEEEKKNHTRREICRILEGVEGVKVRGAAREGRKGAG